MIIHQRKVGGQLTGKLGGVVEDGAEGDSRGLNGREV